MATDPYASCPCGSGKKFKWCCMDIHAEIDRAFAQNADGQHDTALRTMEGVVAAHPGNPEAWGRQAQLLSANGKFDEAEQALQKAFDVNPNYPFGLLLRGQFRLAEGELIGALMLFRRAVDAYTSDAHDALAYLHELIADGELKLNHPVAARAALRQAVRLQPGNEELRQAFEGMFGPDSRLPEVARKEYKFLPGPNDPAWAEALERAGTGKLSDAAVAFQQLTEQFPQLNPAWYNLGLIRSWQGDNASALEALTRYVELEADENQAGEVWALAEVLRCGAGLEDQADYVEHRAFLQVRDPQPVVGLLQEWQESMRAIGLRSDQQQGMLTALVLEDAPTLALSGVSAPPSRLAAYLLVAGNLLQFWHPNKESLDRVVAEAQQKLGGAVGEPQRQVGPVMFGDVAADALMFPRGQNTELEAEVIIKENAQKYFEETWIHKPLRSLGGSPPIDAAGHAALRKKLRGVVRFVQDCTAGNALRIYDFDRLRRKLGLLDTPAAPEGGAVPDISALGAPELAALSPESLAEEQLEQAFRAALQLDARDLAGRFARAIVGRPANPVKPDRYPYFTHLIQQEQAAGHLDAALDQVNAGEQADCEQNEGRRRNDYELKRGQLLAKRGEADQAQDVFERLVARVPGELKFAGSAAEAMLGMKQAGRALKFAEQGLAQARAQNNRDSEGYFLELIGAAKKQGG
jgi:tetratricopeptide (TPR) repeat protein